MENEFKEIRPEELKDNPFKIIGKDWMLITAGNKTHANAMTASWGGIGRLWEKDVVFIFVRQSRYTKTLLDQESGFSCAFFDHQKYLKELAYMGSASGREEDKIKKAGFSLSFEKEIPYLNQARLVFICSKLSKSSLSEETILDKKILTDIYGDNDFHHLYVGEIKKVLIKE
ncbi:MAG: flavin reductase family protein [Bacilli bacterium]|jgi:flavin reductase (DIM6/NTAB) family NADH-FMN oxidoreductase RutF|nr:flavin reductase family protein [Bacilli bacterium]